MIFLIHEIRCVRDFFGVNQVTYNNFTIKLQMQAMHDSV